MSAKQTAGYARRAIHAPAFLAFIATGLLLASPSNGVGGDYTVTDLGSLDGPSAAWGINNEGDVVGFYGSFNQRAFLYSAGVMTDIGTLGGIGWQTQALAINDSGQIVGISALTLSGSVSHAFLYQAGVMTDLGTLENSNGTSFAQAINNSGQVVGGSDGIPGGRRPFLYSGGQMTDLGRLPGYVGTAIALGINDSGQVVGYDNLDDHLSGDPGFAHAFLWQNGMMTDLGTLGGTGSVATAINQSGQVVGYSTNAMGSIDAFLYQNGTMTDLGGPGGGGSVAWAINKQGQIVGSRVSSGDGALLYEGGAWTDLNSLVSPSSGWDLLEARGINDSTASALEVVAGQRLALVIVGQVGTNPP